MKSVKKGFLGLFDRQIYFKTNALPIEMKAIFKALIILAVALAALGGFAAYLYFTDYSAEATITGKGQDEKGYWVEATTRIGGFKIKQYLDTSTTPGMLSWYAVQNGNFIVYNIHSGHLRLWENLQDYLDGKIPVYDSA
ncbi:MAG: hypothetical protein PHH26_01175 [Candidatus Thermoplasmatota archaeon]|nr:hypothetical protein [Candidatus Thermoplasmatota archaeon]